ncbi:PAS domain S-box protein [Spirulina sp. CS-785/01]|uniref:PAS domain S-box protein n=1 Tax=Spirulina sp. CS-785/01 TaxID=3021716 RepID=UPI00232CCB24|nr:PAS domain S-box protein [Spirulina sp. CS-785/01]MDB9313959.1 PAS domain S-box protein [Spirulina sp. CS-785/01]
MPVSTNSLSSVGVDEVMIDDPLIVSPETPVKTAITLLNDAETLSVREKTPHSALERLKSEGRASCLLVVKNQQCIGLLTQKDLLQLTLSDALDTLVLWDVMIPSPVTLSTSKVRDMNTVQDCLQRYDIDHLPLIDEQNHLVGLLTYNIVEYALLAEQNATLDQQVHTLTATSHLQQSCQDLENLFDLSSDLIQMVSLEDGQFLYVNQTWQNTLGYSTEELANLTLFEIIAPHSQKFVHPLWEALQQGETQDITQFTLTVVTKMGETFFLEGSLQLSPHSTPSPAVQMIFRNVTAQRQAEETLQQQTEILRIFYDSSPLMMGVVELSEGDMRIVSHNQTTALFFNCTSQELTGKWMSELDPDAERRQLWYDHYSHSSQTREPCTFEYEHQTDTESYWLLVRVAFLGWSEQQRPQCSYIVQDISEQQAALRDRKQAQANQLTMEQVDRELQLLENILEVVLGGYWDWNIPNNQEYLSPGFKRILGYEDHELTNSPETWQTLIFPEDLTKVLQTFDSHIQSQGQEPFYNEVRYRHKDGSTVWVICYGQVIEWDSQGNPLRMIGCHIDISDRKQATKQINRQLEILETAIDGIAIVQDGIFQYINRSHLEMFGYDSQADLLGQPWHQLYSQAERERFEQEIFPLLDQTGNWRGEALATRKDGSTFYQEIALSRNESGDLICVCRDISERQQVEQELKNAKDQLELVLQASSEGFWDWDFITGEIYFSPQWKAMLGYEDHELENSFEMWESLIFEEDYQEALQLVERYNQGKIKQFMTTQRFHHREGFTVYVLSKAIHLKDDQGQVVRMVGSHLDITEQKRQEQALQQSEEQYRTIIETTLEGVWMVDANGITTFVNQRMASMLGYTVLEMLGMRFYEYIDSEDEINLPLDLQRQQGDATQKPFQLRRKDNTSVWALISITPLTTPDGQYNGCVGLLSDVTQMVAIQNALKTSEMQLSGILNSSLDGIMAFRSVRDAEGKIIDFEWLLSNPTACKMVNRTPDQLIGRRLLEEMPGNRAEGLFDMYVQVVERGTPQKREFYYNYDGIDCWFENIAVQLGDGFAVTFRDITNIKQSERALQEANHQLEVGIRDLKQRNEEMSILSEISDFLQACLTVEEACSAIAHLVEPLFPNCSGGIFITHSSRNLVENIASWGTESPEITTFEPSDCWGLRRGRVYQAKAKHPNLHCKHTPVSVHTLCVPMIAQGETLGLFHLSAASGYEFSAATQQLAQTVAEQMGLAIANLNLRETLRNQSIRDALTGLFNRRYLEEYLTQELFRAQRQDYALGVIMIDVDHFKRLNDTYGHEAGDYVLESVANLLKANVRGSDVACRYGGEELTALLPEASLEITVQRAEDIRQALNQLVMNYQGKPLKVTASFGVASFPQHGATGHAILQAADAALYRAKAAGRDQVMVAP